jgi:AcrR family transcriptional regulator
MSYSVAMARPRKFDEHDVVRRARAPFWDHGYAATTVDELTAATGLGKSSLYGAFGDKHELFLRVFDDYCLEAMEAVRRDLEGPDEEAYARLRGHLHDKAATSAGDARGCLLAKETAELAGADAAVAGRAAQTYAIYEDLLVAAVEGAQRHGELRDDLDARIAAGLLLTVLRGMEALGRAGRDEPALRASADAALAGLAAVPALSRG